MPTKPDHKPASPPEEAKEEKAAVDMKSAVKPAQWQRAGGDQQSKLMLNSLKEKEKALVEKLDRIKKLSPDDKDVLSARTQATLDGVREQIKAYG